MEEKRMPLKVDLKVDSDIRKNIDKTIQELERLYGQGIVRRMSDKVSHEYDVISTGALTLDLAIGIGGLPMGRIVEIYGDEGSGKTSLCLTVVSEAQKKGLNCAYIDAEHSLDIKYARAIGVDVDNIIISQPDYGEQALTIVEKLIESGDFSVVIIDSVAALVPQSELEGEMGDAQMGKQARMMGQALRRLTGLVGRNKALLIFINQTRQKLGGYGNPITTTGGLALKFFSSIRIEIKKREVLKKGEVVIGNSVRAKVVKNKCSAPFRVADFDIIYGKGISKAGCLVDTGLALNVFSRKGTWYYYKDDRIAQGREALIKLLEENKSLFDEVNAKILENTTKLDLVSVVDGIEEPVED